GRELEELVGACQGGLQGCVRATELVMPRLEPWLVPRQTGGRAGSGRLEATVLAVRYPRRNQVLRMPPQTFRLVVLGAHGCVPSSTFSTTARADGHPPSAL
ncbi:MAG TPA: hypothetical protein VFG59_00760, partial [Anaeromyxobacter sp.]|nr:hypothetical protein [Anaeromyxobacter sp.]